MAEHHHRRRHHHHRHRHHIHLNRRIKGLLGAGTLLLVLIIALAGGAVLDRLMPEPGEEADPPESSIAWLETVERNGQTYRRRANVSAVLLMGADRSSSEPRTGYRDGGQADFIMLLVVDEDAHTITPVAVNRDTLAPVTIVGVLGKESGKRNWQICLAFGFGKTDEQGSAYVRRALTELLGLNINITRTLAMRLDGISVLTDALGGVDVTVPDDMTAADPAWTPGTKVHLTGENAERFVRSRKGVAEGSNRARMERQRVFMQGVRDAAVKGLKTDKQFLANVFDAIESTCATDMTRGWILGTANRCWNYEFKAQETLPGDYVMHNNGFLGYKTDPDRLTDWVISHFYEPVSP